MSCVSFLNDVTFFLWRLQISLFDFRLLNTQASNSSFRPNKIESRFDSLSRETLLTRDANKWESNSYFCWIISHDERFVFSCVVCRKIVGHFTKSLSNRAWRMETAKNQNYDDDNDRDPLRSPKQRLFPNRVSARCWTAVANRFLCVKCPFRRGGTLPTLLLSVRGVSNCLNQRVLSDHCHNVSRQQARLYSSEKEMKERSFKASRVLSRGREAPRLKTKLRGFAHVHFVP